MSKKLKFSLMLGFILLAVILLQASDLHQMYLFQGRYILSKVFIMQPDIDTYRNAERFANWCDFNYGNFSNGPVSRMPFLIGGNWYFLTCHYDNANEFGYYTHEVLSTQLFSNR